MDVDNLLPPYKVVKLRNSVDRYGFSHLLADRCRLSHTPRCFANWVHGWSWTGNPSSEFLACSKQPRSIRMVVRDEVERVALVEEGFQDVRIGGLPFAYVGRQHCSRSRHALLAFTAHSAEASSIDADQRAYLDYLESIRRDYSAVYVSVYYLDLERKIAEEIRRRGLRLIEGARPDDVNSLMRVRAMLDAFEHVTTNVMGSHVIYALYSNCRVSFCGPMYQYEERALLGRGNPHNLSQSYVQAVLGLHSERYLRNRFGRFFVSTPAMGTKDQDFATHVIGASHIMSLAEIRDVLGWTVKGQLRGYSIGAKRRLIRGIFGV